MRVDIFRMLAACNKCINQQGNLLVGLPASGAGDGTERSGAERWGLAVCGVAVPYGLRLGLK